MENNGQNWPSVLMRRITAIAGSVLLALICTLNVLFDSKAIDNNPEIFVYHLYTNFCILKRVSLIYCANLGIFYCVYSISSSETGRWRGRLLG